METPKKAVFDFKQYAVLKSKIRPYAANEAMYAVRLRRRAGGSPSLWEEAILLEAVIIIKFLVLVCSLVNFFFYKERQM